MKKIKNKTKFQRLPEIKSSAAGLLLHGGGNFHIAGKIFKVKKIPGQ